MKKFFSLILVGCLSVGLLSGCGHTSEAASEDGKTTITIWHDKEDEVTAILEEKLASLPDVEVVIEKKSSLTDSLKLVANDPNAAPDMYIFAHDKIGVFAEMGILEPITNIIPEEELSDYMDITLDAATYEGEIYQLPIYYETLLFMYNRLYMSDEEVPSTTEELYEYMKENTGGGHYGFVEQHSTPYYAAGWINGFGEDVINDDGTPNLNSKSTIAALEYHKKFVELMPGETEYATVNTLFSEGMAHSTIAGPWLVPTVREAGMDVGIAPMPTIDQTGNPISPYMGVQGVQVLKNAAENKGEAVEEVLRALMDTNVEVELAEATGCAPANETCYDLDEIKNDETVMAMKETAEHATPMSNLPEMDVMWTVMGDLLTDVNMSGKDVEESADSAQAEAEKLIKQMK